MGRLVIFAAIVSLVGAGSSAAATLAHTYDRTPIRISGAYPDGYGQSTSKAEAGLYNRYPGIRQVTCFPAIMLGYEGRSSFTNGGLTRFWDKLVCAGSTTRGITFALIYDAKGPYSWIIYRLKGVSVSGLLYG